MADTVPAIRLTDPHAKDSALSYPASPGNTVRWDGEFRRPSAPASRQDQSGREKRPTPAAQAIHNPARVIRSISSNIIHSPHGPTLPGSSNRRTSAEQAPSVDPVTQQIIQRTGETFHSPARKDSDEVYQSAEEQDTAKESHHTDSPNRIDSATGRASKHKDHRVSFFSRLIGGRKKEEEHEVGPDDVSVAESRPEGHDAEIFSPTFSSSEFSHALSNIPKYIRVRTRHARKKQHFDNLFLAQDLTLEVDDGAHSRLKQRKTSNSVHPDTRSNAVWATEFSRDGRYLATAGDDQVVRVWAVITTPEERAMELRRDSHPSINSNHQPLGQAASVFKSKPIREYKGHTDTVLDLSWSKSNFLISSSMDMTVRLWHVTRPDCLCTFKHADMIPAIAFHPNSDLFFLAGSLDSKLRLWSVTEKKVLHWVQAPAMVTAVSFAPDAKHCFTGCADGSVQFYETDGLKYLSQLKIKSSNNKYEKGSKITGIHACHVSSNSGPGHTKVIVTSNDSRVRMYNLRDKSLELKLKGSVNSSSQIRASVSDDQRYVCSGSEDNRAYIWPLQLDQQQEDLAKHPTEHFQAHSAAVTCVRFAPSKTRHLVARSSDPIFDLCNPPSSQAAPPGEAHLERKDSQTSSTMSKPESSSETPRSKLDQSSIQSASRCSHHTGNILITTSCTGAIKVFRQDCAAKYRQPTVTSARRITSMPIGHSGRSIRTRASDRSMRSASTQAPQDRILSWRQTINSSPSIRNGSISSKHSARSLSPRKSSQTHRSVSGPALGRSNENRIDSHASSGTSTPAGGSTSTSPQVPSGHRIPKIAGMTPIHTSHNPSQQRLANSPQTNLPSTLPRQRPAYQPAGPRDSNSSLSSDVNGADHNATQSIGSSEASEDKNPLRLSGEQSDLFWNTAVIKRFADRARDRIRERKEAEREKAKLERAADKPRLETIVSSRRGSLLGPPSDGDGEHYKLSREVSPVSRLSIESSDDGERGGDAGREEAVGS